MADLHRSLVRLSAAIIALAFRAPADAAVQRFAVSGPSRTLTVEALNDQLLHFELALSSSASSAGAPLPTTPSLQKMQYPGPQSWRQKDNECETSFLKVTIDPESLCAAEFDK